MDWKKYIERNPEIMLGKPVFKGTRLTVEYVLERLGQGASPEELLENYDGLRYWNGLIFFNVIGR